MTTSSQTPLGSEPPEVPDGGAPLHDPRPLQAAIASYAEVIPAPGGTRYDDPWQGSDVPHRLRSPYPEPTSEGPVCAVCGVLAGAADEALYPDPSGRRYRSGAQVLFCGTHVPDATPVQAATGVIAAAMDNGSGTAREIAQAEEDAGLLFDPQRVKDIDRAAREQTRAELAADLAQAQQSLDWFRERWQAIGRLCEGRPLDYMLEVGEVLAAADGRTPTDAPLTLTWDGVDLPDGGAREARAIVECITARGGRAALELDGLNRQALASLLDAEIRDVNAPCPTQGCGTDHHLDAGDPELLGWIRAEVAGIDEPARWYCSPMCVENALVRAADKLTVLDDQAELDGGV